MIYVTVAYKSGKKAKAKHAAFDRHRTVQQPGRNNQRSNQGAFVKIQ
mgnify:CR=1 FL=1